MPDFSKRSEAVEIMDDLNASGPVIDQTLVELEFINKWLGGNAITLNGLEKLLIKCSGNLTIADLGCGGGDMLMLIQRRIRNRFKAELIGIDANPNIIDYARKNTIDYPEITFRSIDVLSEKFKKETFDIVFATLFFHHFSKEQLVELFRHLHKNTRCGIVVNDLHRHWLAYYSIKYLTRWFSRSSMVINDAPLSVHRGFKKSELTEILLTAGIKNYTLKWRWAFRWQLIIYSTQ